MKKFLLLTAGIALGMSAMAQTNFNCVSDTWIRSNNPTWNKGGNSDKIEIRKDALNDDDGNPTGEYATFAGLVGFNFSVPNGMRVQSATMRLVTERWKGCPINVYGYTNDFDEGMASWETEEYYVTSALNNNPVANFTPNAQRNKALGSDEIGEDYRDLSSWTNEIDVTAYVMSLSPLAGRVNFLLVPADDNVNQNCFFTKETEGVVNAKDASLSFAAADLVPVLTVTFTEDKDSETNTLGSVADTWIRENNTFKGGNADKMEIRWNYDADNDVYMLFAGLLSFNLNVPQNMEVTGASLRLVTERWKGCPINVYGYDNNFDEGGACWDTEGSYVESALAGEPIVNFTPKGQRNKSLGSDELGEDFRDLSAWTNVLDVTDYVKGVANGRVNFLLTPAEPEQVGQNCFYTKEIESVVNAKDATLTFAAADLVPQLTVSMAKTGDNGENAVEMVIDLDAPVEYYNLNGVKVVNPDKGIYIVRQGNSVKKVVL